MKKFQHSATRVADKGRIEKNKSSHWEFHLEYQQRIGVVFYDITFCGNCCQLILIALEIWHEVSNCGGAGGT